MGVAFWTRSKALLLNCWFFADAGNAYYLLKYNEAKLALTFPFHMAAILCASLLRCRKQMPFYSMVFDWLLDAVCCPVRTFAVPASSSDVGLILRHTLCVG